MINTLFKLVLSVIAFIIVIPTILYISLIVHIKLSEERVFEKDIIEFGVIEVIKKVDPDFSGSGYSYNVYFKAIGNSSSYYVTSWERPPIPGNIETYVYFDNLILLTPKRNGFNTLNKKGQWKRYSLDKMFNNGELFHRDVEIEGSRYPNVEIIKFDQEEGYFSVELSATLERKYTITLRLLHTEEKLEVVDVSDNA